MSAQKNAELGRASYDAWNERDFDRLVSFGANDVQVVLVPFGNVMHGPEGYRQYADGWASAFPDGRIEITRIMADDNGAVVEFIGRGTQTGPLSSPSGTIPATGKRVEIQFCDVLEMTGGKISRLRSYFDSATMLRQLGELQ
jgi:steroid delta-isomerase-like uncharacterized protein